VPRGRVERASDEKGCCFVEPEDGGEDFFVRYSGVAGEGYRNLEEGGTVEVVDGWRRGSRW